MNCLDFEGCGFKVKVCLRSDVKNFGSLYLLYGLKDFAQMLYTVGHKKCPTLFWTITPMFLGGFLHFLY